jgi:hypothetical protein
MTGDDLAEIFRQLSKRRPFRSFMIELQSGDRLTVSHPEAIVRTGAIFAHRAPDRGLRVFDAPSVSQVIIPPPAK